MATGAATAREPPHRIRLTGRLTVTTVADQGICAPQTEVLCAPQAEVLRIANVRPVTNQTRKVHIPWDDLESVEPALSTLAERR
jgi:hypothetical protein